MLTDREFHQTHKSHADQTVAVRTEIPRELSSQCRNSLTMHDGGDWLRETVICQCGLSQHVHDSMKAAGRLTGHQQLIVQ